MQQHIILHRKLSEEATKKIWQNCLKIKQEKLSEDTPIIRSYHLFFKVKKISIRQWKKIISERSKPWFTENNSKSSSNSIAEKITVMDVISSLQRNIFNHLIIMISPLWNKNNLQQDADKPTFKSDQTGSGWQRRELTVKGNMLHT